MLLDCCLHSFNDFLLNVHFEVVVSWYCYNCFYRRCLTPAIIYRWCCCYRWLINRWCLEIDKNLGQGLVTGVNDTGNNSLSMNWKTFYYKHIQDFVLRLLAKITVSYCTCVWANKYIHICLSWYSWPQWEIRDGREGERWKSELAESANGTFPSHHHPPPPPPPPPPPSSPLSPRRGREGAGCVALTTIPFPIGGNNVQN